MIKKFAEICKGTASQNTILWVIEPMSYMFYSTVMRRTAKTLGIDIDASS